MLTEISQNASEQTKPPIKIKFTLTVRMKHDSTQKTEDISEDSGKGQSRSTNEATDNSLNIYKSNIKSFAMADNEPHNTSLHINIQENIGKNEEGKRPRLRALAPKPPPESRSRSDSGSSVNSEEPFPDFDPSFPSIDVDDGAEQSCEVMSNNNVPHNEVNYQYLNNFQTPSMGQHPNQPQLQHPESCNSMNSHLHPNMAQPAIPFTQNQNQGSYNTMQNVNMGQPQNQFSMQSQTMNHQQMMQTIHQSYANPQQQHVYQNHPQQQGNYGHGHQHPQFNMGQQPPIPFANAQITQGPPVETQHLAYVDPRALDTSKPRFHQTQSDIDPDDPAGNWGAFLDSERNNNMRKRSLTSAHPEIGPNSYRSPAMGTAVNHSYLVGEYVSNEEAWSGAPRGAIKRTLASSAPQFTQQQMYSQQMNNQLMIAQQTSSQVNMGHLYPQQMGSQQMLTPQMTPQPSQEYGTSPGQMGPPGFTQIPERNRSMSRTSSVTSPNLLGRKNSTSSRSSKASPAHSRSTSTGISKRTSESGSAKRSSFSKSGVGPKISVPGWASGGPNTRRPSVNGGTKANPIRVSTSPVDGIRESGSNKQIMSPALTLTSPEASSSAPPDMNLPSPEMMTSDQSVAFLKDSLLEDYNFTISEMEIPPSIQERQLSSLLQAQIHLSQLVPPALPSLDSPLKEAVEIQEEGEVKEMMNKLIRALQTGVDGLVNVAKVEDKAAVDVPAARGRMKQALGDLVGEMGKVLGFGNQEPWDPDMSDMNAILEGWQPQGGNVDDLFGEELENGNDNANGGINLE